MASNFSAYSDISVRSVDNGNFVTICLSLPPLVSSGGIWNYILESSETETARPAPLPLLELQMLVIFSVIMFVHFFVRLFGLPAFVSQIIAGLILGSSWNGSSKSFDKFKEYLFPIESQDILGLMSGFGYTLFVFLTGVRMDIFGVKRSGKLPLICGVLTIVIPIIVGSIAALAFSSIGDEKEVAYMELIAAHQSFTSFAVVLYLLDHLEILTSEVGRLALNTTIVADLVSLAISFIATVVKNARNNGFASASMTVVLTTATILIVLYMFRPAMLWIVRSTPNGRSVHDGYICIIILLVLVASVTSNTIGRSVYSGPFILGLAVPEGPPLGATLAKKLDGVIMMIFVPLFVTISVIKVDISFLTSSGAFLTHSTIVILMTSFAKMVVCIGSSLYFKMSSYDALAFGLMMSSKGIVELVGSSNLYDNTVLNEQTFAVLVVDILFFSILMPIIVKYAYDPSRKYNHYQKKNILNLKPDAELSILGCFHTQDDVPVVFNILDALCPTKENPVSLYALHLVELVGRATPVFISHELYDQKCSSEEIFSGKIIQMLRNYERSNEGVVSIEAFTAIAPVKLMHDDICTVAVNKLTSLIILPFHRRWTRDGFVDSEDNTLRALNCHVLERAPCSVGILIDRGHLSSYRPFDRSCTPLLQVAMIFIGGQDDREAFSFAKRMVKELGTAQLTVIRLLAEDKSISHWEMVLDTELLSDVGESFKYGERIAEEGAETAAIVRSMGDEYDLIIVGRREGIESPQTSGLLEWNEFPELGIIGDMLASADSYIKASTLVVQQEQQWSF